MKWAEDLLVGEWSVRLDDELPTASIIPLSTCGSSTGARENFLSGEELDAVKTRRRGLKGDAKQDLEAIQSTK